MSDPQAWTLIGVFSASILGGLTLVTTMLSRVIRAEIGGLRAEIATLTARFDHLDRDVQTLSERMWRGDHDA
jgi:hypothetical protein